MLNQSKKRLGIACVSLLLLTGISHGMDSSSSNKITLLTDTAKMKVEESKGVLIITVPNGTKVIKKTGEAPYCLKGCDLPIDCDGNKPPAPAGEQWECDNKPGACIGTCYLAPAS